MTDMQMKLLKLAARQYYDTLKLFPKVKEVIKKFDGKVLNVKLSREMKNIPANIAGETAHIYASTGTDLHIYVNSNLFLETANCGGIYSPVSKITFVYFYEKNGVLTGENGNRLNAAACVENLEKHENNIRKKLQKIHEDISTAEEKISQLHELIKTASALKNSLSCELISICGYELKYQI